MKKASTKKIRNAINTLCAAKSNTELIGIVNALGMAVQEEVIVYIAMRKTEHEGKERKIYMLLKDKDEHTLFPFFTDLEEFNAFKSSYPDSEKIVPCLMKLGELLQFVVNNGVCDGIVINPKGLSFAALLNFFERVLNETPTSHITLIHSDISQMHTDAIVGCVNEKGEIMEAEIQKCIGEICSKDLADFNPNVGDVMGLSSENSLCSPLILFTRPPIFETEDDFNQVYSCYYNCMNVAEQAECTSIAFSCIGVEGGAVPLHIAIAASISAVSDWMDDHEGYVIDAYFCCPEEAVKEKYQKYIDECE